MFKPNIFMFYILCSILFFHTYAYPHGLIDGGSDSSSHVQAQPPYQFDSLTDDFDLNLLFLWLDSCDTPFAFNLPYNQPSQVGYSGHDGNVAQYGSNTAAQGVDQNAYNLHISDSAFDLPYNQPSQVNKAGHDGNTEQGVAIKNTYNLHISDGAFDLLDNLYDQRSQVDNARHDGNVAQYGSNTAPQGFDHLGNRKKNLIQEHSNRDAQHRKLRTSIRASNLKNAKNLFQAQKHGNHEEQKLANLQILRKNLIQAQLYGNRQKEILANLEKYRSGSVTDDVKQDSTSHPDSKRASDLPSIYDHVSHGIRTTQSEAVYVEPVAKKLKLSEESHQRIFLGEHYIIRPHASPDIRLANSELLRGLMANFDIDTSQLRTWKDILKKLIETQEVVKYKIMLQFLRKKYNDSGMVFSICWDKFVKDGFIQWPSSLRPPHYFDGDIAKIDFVLAQLIDSTRRLPT